MYGVGHLPENVWGWRPIQSEIRASVSYPPPYDNDECWCSLSHLMHAFQGTTSKLLVVWLPSDIPIDIWSFTVHPTIRGWSYWSYLLQLRYTGYEWPWGRMIGIYWSRMIGYYIPQSQYVTLPSVFYFQEYIFCKLKSPCFLFQSCIFWIQ